MEIKRGRLGAFFLFLLREGEFHLEEEIHLRVFWRRLAEKTKETSSKEIDLPFLAFAEAKLQISEAMF
jgi:hypothetical protein